MMESKVDVDQRLCKKNRVRVEGDRVFGNHRTTCVERVGEIKPLMLALYGFKGKGAREVDREVDGAVNDEWHGAIIG